MILLERFKETERVESDDKFDWHEKRWTVSTDHHLAIRQLNFDFEDYYKNFFVSGTIESISKTRPDKLIHADEILKDTLRSIVDIDKEVNYTKIKLPKELIKEPSNAYTVNDKIQFGYSGVTLDRIVRVLGKDCTIHFPNFPIPGYATKDDYVIAFACIVSDEIKDIIVVEEDDRNTFEDDVW